MSDVQDKRSVVITKDAEGITICRDLDNHYIGFDYHDNGSIKSYTTLKGVYKMKEIIIKFLDENFDKTYFLKKLKDKLMEDNAELYIPVFEPLYGKDVSLLFRKLIEENCELICEETGIKESEFKKYFDWYMGFKFFPNLSTFNARMLDILPRFDELINDKSYTTNINKIIEEPYWCKQMSFDKYMKILQTNLCMILIKYYISLTFNSGIPMPYMYACLPENYDKVIKYQSESEEFQSMIKKPNRLEDCMKYKELYGMILNCEED